MSNGHYSILLYSFDTLSGWLRYDIAAGGLVVVTMDTGHKFAIGSLQRIKKLKKYLVQLTPHTSH
jgi:hypothetical protein